ncbi:MAG: glycosyltransferase family 39 protein [Acidobacteriota bacterium]|nr:glycosyltransferase family 39 protein [Acidobacteriota bacterium]
MTEPPLRRAEWLAVLASCTAASVAAVLWSWQHHAMLNYGDAVAHLHIARRIFDSHRPGITQLGSVWLPLPHLLLVPFVAVYGWWANGIAGTIPSALAYLASCAGVYRLARLWLQPPAAAIALAFFAANPNLLYLQTTAMTEPLFLCELIWAVALLVQWRASVESDHRRAMQLLWLVAAVLVAAVFTRYDGWILALLAWVAIGIVLLRRGKLRSRAFWLASVFVVTAPIAWFIYNAAAFGDWLDFARGPYSAKAIELHTSVGSGPPHPGWHNPWVSLLFFAKTAEMDAAAVAWGNVLLVLSLLGTAWACLTARRRAVLWTLLLWLPVPFYAYSIAYGSVPVFIPVWWPHSWYNTRYGMELLPAFALGLGFAAQFALAAAREFKPRWASYVAGMLFALVVLNACEIVRERPLTYVEGTKNINARRPLETQIPPVLRALLATRPGGIVLMETSVYPQLVTLTGIPLRQTINESDKQFYQAALAAPAAHAAIVLAFDGDEIDNAVHAHPGGLIAVQRFTAPGQPSATVYVSNTPALNKAPAR